MCMYESKTLDHTLLIISYGWLSKYINYKTQNSYVLRKARIFNQTLQSPNIFAVNLRTQIIKKVCTHRFKYIFSHKQVFRTFVTIQNWIYLSNINNKSIILIINRLYVPLNIVIYKE